MNLKTTLFAALAVLLCACSCASDGPSPLKVSLDGRLHADSPFDHSHHELDKLLAAYVSREGVRYADLAGESGKLDSYLAGVQAVSPEELASWTRPQRFAFWINAYNAHILKLIIENYPLDSIRDLGGISVFGQVWDMELIPMEAHNPDGGGAALSFNDLEHKILRPDFEDARVHAAINCASESCPPLSNEAFVADRLEEQLDGAMTAFIVDSKRNHLRSESGELELSRIFDWFEGDFIRDEGSVREYVLRFAGDAGAPWILEAGTSYLDYSWALNDLSK